MANKKETINEKGINTNKIKEELTEYINTKIDEKIDLSKISKEVKEYVDVLVKKDLSYEIEKANKKLIKEKNRKIFFKNVTILILIAIIGFLVYLLYKANYFDKFFNKNSEPQVIIKEVVKESEAIDDTPLTFEELEREYGHLINNYYINENCKYLNDYYSGKLSQEIKEYITLNNLNSDKIAIEEDYNIIDSKEIKSKYEELFGGEYSPSSFEYDGNKIRYVTKLDSFMSDTIINKNKSSIKREIVNIDVLDDSVKITTVEGLIKDNKLYNIETGKQIESYKKDSLSNYEDSINKIVYVFENNKLVGLEN